jgi:hypothetical protein
MSMPRYRIVLTGNGVNEERIITTTVVPTNADRLLTDAFTGLSPDVVYSVTVTRLQDSVDEPLAGREPRTGSVRPKRFEVDFVSPASTSASVGWIDQRGGRHYRIDTYLDSGGSRGALVQSTYPPSAETDQTNGGATITGLTNGTAYQFEVVRQSSAGAAGLDVRKTSNAKAATPFADGFDAATGYTGRGPADIDGDFKAQIVTEDSTGQTGVLIQTKAQNFNRVRIRYFPGPVTSTADEVTAEQPRKSEKIYFFPLTLDVFRDSVRTLLGVTVLIDNQQLNVIATLSPTYV